MSNQPVTRRGPISLAIKVEIRNYHQNNNSPNTNEMISWAEGKYGISFIPSTMRTILIPKPKRNTPPTGFANPSADRQRDRLPSWPELEVELAQWYRSLTTPPKGQQVKEKAIELWQELSPKYYSGQKEPSFGDSWRDRFKERHQFKQKKDLLEDSLANSDDFVDVPGGKFGLLSTGDPMDIDNDAGETYAPNPGSNAAIELDSYHARTFMDPAPSPRLNPLPAIAHHLVLANPGRNESRNSISNVISQHRSILPPPDSSIGAAMSQSIQYFSGRSIATAKAHRAAITRHLFPTESSLEVYLPRIVSNKEEQCRVPGSTSLNFPTPTIFYNSKRNKEMQKCICNLLLMAKTDEDQISSFNVESIITTLLSTMNAPMTLDTPHGCNRTLFCYHKLVADRMEANRRASVKALRLLQLAENFKIKKNIQENFSEWETDCIFNKFVRMPSRDRSPARGQELTGEEGSGSQFNETNLALLLRNRFNSAHSLKYRKSTFFSMISKNGRVDIRTSTSSNANLSTAFSSLAEVILTLPAKKLGSAQIRFLQSQHVTAESNILLTPTLSVRCIIPDNSEIFQIAGTGTLEALREKLVTGKASLTDCDTRGRSLINYALANYNIEVCDYLLDYLDDINSYEIDELGFLSPLTGLLFAHCVDLTKDYCEGRTRCFKKMLERGADPTLQMPMGGGRHCNMFEIELGHGPKATVEALVNSEYPSMSFNSLGDGGKEYDSPLYYLADSFRMGFSTTFQVPEKFAFLLKRGADVFYKDENGNTCLHLALTYDKVSASQLTGSGIYNEGQFKSILMALISAGADVEYFNNFGQTPSDIACQYDHEELWIQVLAACGYDPWGIFGLENEWLQRYTGAHVFSTTPINGRDTFLFFDNYYAQRESIEREGNTGRDEDWNAKIRAEIQAIYGDYDESDGAYSADGFSDCEFSMWDELDNVYSAEDNVYSAEGDVYTPINGDIAWLAYVPRHQFIWYWVKTGYSSYSNSESWERFGETEDED